MILRNNWRLARLWDACREMRGVINLMILVWEQRERNSRNKTILMVMMMMMMMMMMMLAGGICGMHTKY